jgi:hypothetical protein
MLAKSKQKKPAKPPKYRDPATGKTWNGHGKTPLWLASVDDRAAYLIDTQADTTWAQAKPARKPRAANGTAKHSAAPQTEEPKAPAADS